MVRKSAAKMTPSDQVREICLMLANTDEEAELTADAVFFVRRFVLESNKLVHELRKRVALLEADLEERTDELARVSADNKACGCGNPKGSGSRTGGVERKKS